MTIQDMVIDKDSLARMCVWYTVIYMFGFLSVNVPTGNPAISSTIVKNKQTQAASQS